MKAVKTFLAIFLSLLLVSPSTAGIRIITIGDSTMANYDESRYKGSAEQRGWAQMLTVFLRNDVTLINRAKSGRSSKSFYNHHWRPVRDMIEPGDYVFIQFGHNDEKNDGLDTEGRTVDDRGTAAWGQYREYLTKYVVDVRERGGIPVFFTSIVRGEFLEEGGLNGESLHNLYEIAGDDRTMNYPQAMRELAQELDVPLIDMTEKTRVLIEEYGPEKAKKYIWCNKDTTHLKAMGGTIIARVAVEALRGQGILIDAFIF